MPVLKSDRGELDMFARLLELLWPHILLCAPRGVPVLKGGLAVRKVQTALQTFALESFRPGQLESVLPALHGHDVWQQEQGIAYACSLFLLLGYSYCNHKLP